MGKFKLVAFDMDGTLLKRRTIFVFAERFGFTKDLLRIINNDGKKSYLKSIEIAKYLKGINGEELIDIFRSIPIQNHVETVIEELKKRRIKIALITNSYQFVADDLKERLGIDYAFANNLIIDKGIVTGELILNNKDLSENFNGCKIHSICKGCVLEALCKKLEITLDEAIVVGDGIVDTCMIKKAGLGIAFNAPKLVQKHADIITDDMSVILKHI